MKRTLLCAFLFTVPPAPILAEESFNSKETFGMANQMYEKGRWDEAETLYQSLLRRGLASADLYYNLGNVAYKKGERGRAVLWYERAKRLAPRDSDIEFNLKLAMSHIKDDGRGLPQKILQMAAVNELTLVLMASVWIFFGVGGLVFLGRVRGQVWPQVLLWASGLSLTLAAFWLGVNIRWDRQGIGIVTAPPGEVRNGPGTEYAVGFTIPEGNRVLILNSRPGWIQVGVPEQGLKGWMPESEVEDVRRTDFLIPQS